MGFCALFGIEWNNRSAKLAIAIGEPAQRRKGYGREAMQMFLRYAFHEMNLERIQIYVISYNEHAIRLYDSLGFVREGVLRRAVYRSGRRYDLIVMGLLREEWAQAAGIAQAGA